MSNVQRPQPPTFDIRHSTFDIYPMTVIKLINAVAALIIAYILAEVAEAIPMFEEFLDDFLDGRNG